jgi:hypothetical protein
MTRSTWNRFEPYLVLLVGSLLLLKLITYGAEELEEATIGGISSLSAPYTTPEEKMRGTGVSSRSSKNSPTSGNTCKSSDGKETTTSSFTKGC